MNKALHVALALFALMVLTAHAAESAPRMKHIGVLRTDTVFDAMFEAFRATLGGLGYREGKDVAYDYRLAPATEMQQAASEIIRAGADLLVAAGTPSALAAKRASSTVPIVFLSADPVGSGLVGSLARPGGNITGVATLAPELGTKRLELLRELLPHATRLALLINPDNPVSAIQQRSIELAARDLGFRLRVLNIQGQEELEDALSALNRKSVDAFVMVSDPLLIGNQSRIASHALRNRIPGIFAYRSFADAGGLLSYGADPRAMFEQAAFIADKIFKGSKPADLPVEQPTRFELIVNLKTAAALSLSVPESILLRANEVIR